MTLTLIAMLGGTALAQEHHQHHPPRDAAEYAKVLEDPKRDEWQKPHEVVTALKLRGDEVIADIGSGSGYFTRRFARHAGKVLAVDVDSKLLEMIAKAGDPKIQTVLAAGDDPKLAAASVDTVFFCDVLHHIDNRPAYWAKVKSALKPGGRVVVIDFHKKALPIGPPPAMKIDRKTMIQELKAAGFHLSQSLDSLPYQYFLEFTGTPRSAR